MLDHPQERRLKVSGHIPAGLPPYSTRVSERARRVRLTVTPREGLVVVVPRGLSVDTDSIVASKARWAHDALARVAEKRAQHQAGPEALLPIVVCLPALGVELPVSADATAASRCSAREVDGALRIVGADDAARSLEALRRWLDGVARKELTARLDELSRSTGIPYSRVRITRARTRWGSCSSKGTVSLSRNLLFLPPELVDAVIFHELAHVRIMDHSPRFWALLSSMDPDAMKHRITLRSAGDRVPAWADV